MDINNDIYLLHKPIKIIKIWLGKDYLNLSQIVVRDLNKINIASSSKIICHSEDAICTINKIVDGNEICRDIPNIYHSQYKCASDGHEFIQMEFDTEQYINSIEIYNRKANTDPNAIEHNEMVKNRISTFQLWLYDKNSVPFIIPKLSNDYIQKYFFNYVDILYNKINKIDLQLEKVLSIQKDMTDKHNELVNKLLDRIVELSNKN
jgi:hypothetical protein